MVERQLPKLNVAGSIPVSRLFFSYSTLTSVLTICALLPREIDNTFVNSISIWIANFHIVFSNRYISY